MKVFGDNLPGLTVTALEARLVASNAAAIPRPLDSRFACCWFVPVQPSTRTGVGGEYTFALCPL